MKFRETDEDWSDWHTGLSRNRRRRYKEVRRGILDGLEKILKKHHEGFEINAIVPEGIFATGVKGDKRIYAPIVMLAYNRFPGYKRLQRISSAIESDLPVSRVIYNMTHCVISVPSMSLQFVVEKEQAKAFRAFLKSEGLL